MAQALLSVGIDIGTSTTQLVLSRLTLENRAAPFAVPRVDITSREILYRSGIHFTPLKSETSIDGPGVRDIVAQEYQTSGFRPEQVDTGAVIITGETARKENAEEVLSALSQFAGDFVVATAGPDLESILAARGAGADLYSKEHHTRVLNFDIGGGTSNLALYDHGELSATGCLDVGGRLVKFHRDTGQISYLSPVVKGLIQAGRIPPLAQGRRTAPEELAPLITCLTQALEQAAGLRPGRDLMDALLTQGIRWTPPEGPVVCSFSGGVADCIYQTPPDWLAYGDLGVLLGRAIRDSPVFQTVPMRPGEETIRATVVGAGSHATSLSGSTIFYRQVDFPLKNLPILKLTRQEEAQDPDKLAAAIREKLGWFSGPVALGLRGEPSPSYARIQALSRGVSQGLEPLRQAGYPAVVAVEADMAKALGQAMAPLLAGPLLCLDGVGVDDGDYLDIGAPAAGGSVLPVVIKTLVFTAPAIQSSERS